MGCLVGFANDVPLEIAEKRNLLRSLYWFFFIFYPVSAVSYTTILLFDGFGGSNYDYLLAANKLVEIVGCDFLLIIGYNITEVILLFCFHKYNSYCTITFRSLIAINDISLFIISIIDLINQVKEHKDCTFAACMIIDFPTMLAINCTILYTISQLGRKSSPGNPVIRE